MTELEKFERRVPWWPLRKWVNEVSDFSGGDRVDVVIFNWGISTIFVKQSDTRPGTYLVFDTAVKGPGPEFVCDDALSLQAVLISLKTRGKKAHYEKGHKRKT